jgi:predicted nuclease of restriction endonuclease-like (RecB) superfamily
VKKKSRTLAVSQTPSGKYRGLIGSISQLLEAARRGAARTVNALMTATYWEIGRRIVEFEQGGAERAEYGEELLDRLAADLQARFGRGFSRFNLGRFRAFYLAFPRKLIGASLSLESPSQKRATPSLESERTSPAPFPLPWSHYVRLLTVKNTLARDFYHSEALRGGWSVRQLDRQIGSQFYERTALSKNKASMLRKGAGARPADAVSTDEEVHDPLVLEFLGLKDEYSESDLEKALLRHLEAFLLELGGDFAFIGRQRRLRIGNEWYRVDLLFSPKTALPRRY